MISTVLLVHNHYTSDAPSGENRVVEMESNLLRRHGIDVHHYFRHSDDLTSQGRWGTFKGGLSAPWNPFASRAIRQKIKRCKPNLVHVHNTFPIISPSIFKAIGSQAARVLTLHNYRLFCPAAIPMRDSHPCIDCIETHSVLPSLRHRCYRQSRLATLPVAASVALHRIAGTWVHDVDAFITFSEFQRELMVKAGLPSELVHIRPNFHADAQQILCWGQRRPAAVFAGRLSSEKGVESLIRAWLDWGSTAPTLRVLGNGELFASLKRMANTRPDVPIDFLGRVTPEQARQEIASSRLLILPSICYEGFPVTIAEAFASGTPVAASDAGPLPSIVSAGKNGIIFSPNDPRSLLESVKTAWERKGFLEELGANARLSFDHDYSERVNYQKLMDIYGYARDVHSRRFFD